MENFKNGHQGAIKKIKQEIAILDQIEAMSAAYKLDGGSKEGNAVITPSKA